MNLTRRLAVCFLAAGFVGGAITATSWSVRAQVSTIDFVVPLGTDIVTGAAGDKAIFIGRSTATTVLGNCGDAGDYPVQTAMAVDPGSGTRATRITGIINTTSTTAVGNGTRLVNLALVNQCSIAGASYTKYRGEVQ